MKLILGLAAVAVIAALPQPSIESIDQRIREWQPTARERRWEQIGWAGGLPEAEKLAKANNRPIFLFTHDGRLNVGRC
jgi:hypothetical protein